MFLFGVRRRPDDRFGRWCLPSIITHAGDEARIITTDVSEYGAAARDLMEQADAVGGFECLVILDADMELQGPFVGEVRRVLASSPDAELLCVADAFPHLDDCLVVLRAGVVAAFLAATTSAASGDLEIGSELAEPDPADALALGHTGYAAALRAWVTSRGGSVAFADLPAVCHMSSLSTIDRLTQILAASRQGSWAERIEAAVRTTSAGVPGESPAGLAADAAGAAHDADALAADPAVGPTMSGAIDADADPPRQGSMDSGGSLPLDATEPVGSRSRWEAPWADPARPDLTCHLSPLVRRVLVAGPAPEPVADAIAASTGAQLTTVRTARGDLDGLSLGAPYDSVVLADALAYVDDPEGVLRRLVPLLQPGGNVIAALPNAKHWMHLLDLLLHDRLRFGEFDLVRAGAPLRLFTLVEATLMFDRAGLTEYDFCNGTRHPAPEPETFAGLLRLHEESGLSAQDARTLLTTYSYVFVVRAPA